MKKILVLDEYQNVQNVFGVLFEEDQVELVGITNADQLLDTVAEFKPDLLIMDQVTAGAKGISIYEQIYSQNSSIKLILTSEGDYLSPVFHQIALFVQKPFEQTNFRLMILDLLKLNVPEEAFPIGY